MVRESFEDLEGLKRSSPDNTTEMLFIHGLVDSDGFVDSVGSVTRWIELSRFLGENSSSSFFFFILPDLRYRVFVPIGWSGIGRHR